MPSLCIVIPTYNRADKLIRLLRNIEFELTDSKLAGQVQVLVSDNASNDDTQSKVANYNPVNFGITYYRQEKNIGFDGNIRFLYSAATTDYVWFFSDDDIMLPGAIENVLEGLIYTKPDVLLFSFIQPPESNTQTFNEQSQFAIFTEPKKIIKLVAQYPKVSIYVCRKVKFSEEQWKELDPFLENGFYWIDLCYSIIAVSAQPRLCIISAPLASCDDGYSNIRFDASVCLERYSIFFHPYVRAHLPALADESRRQSYYDAIQLMFAVRMGGLNSENPGNFDKEIKAIEIRLVPLLMNPRSLLQYLLLKLNLVCLVKAYRRR